MTMRTVERPRRRRRGYTLVEMLLVVTVLGIAAAMLVPNLVGRDTYSIEAALRQLVADVTFAQSDALAGQGHRRVQFLEDAEGEPGDARRWTGWSVYRVDGPGHAGPDPDGPEDYVSAEYDGPTFEGGDGAIPPARPLIVDLSADPRFAGVRIESVELEGGGDAITFDELGGVVASDGGPGTGGRLILRSDNLRYRVEFSPFTGKVVVGRVEVE